VLAYQTIVEELLAAVPSFRRTRGEWDVDLPHVVLGTFALHLREAIRQGGQADLVEPGLRFLDQMARSLDDEVVNLLVVSVLEILADDPVCRQASHRAGGDRMRALLGRVANGWRPAN